MSRNSIIIFLLDNPETPSIVWVTRLRHVQWKCDFQRLQQHLTHVDGECIVIHEILA